MNSKHTNAIFKILITNVGSSVWIKFLRYKIILPENVDIANGFPFLVRSRHLSCFHLENDRNLELDDSRYGRFCLWVSSLKKHPPSTVAMMQICRMSPFDALCQLASSDQHHLRGEVVHPNIYII